MIEKMFQQEIINAELKKKYCILFCFHNILMYIAPNLSKKCIPKGYVKPESCCDPIFQDLMGFNPNNDFNVLLTI